MAHTLYNRDTVPHLDALFLAEKVTPNPYRVRRDRQPYQLSKILLRNELKLSVLFVLEKEIRHNRN